jgi:hypothetical protein
MTLPELIFIVVGAFVAADTYLNDQRIIKFFWRKS